MQQQIQISNNQKVLEAAQLAAQVQGLTSGQIQASQNNTGNNFDVTTRQLLQVVNAFFNSYLRRFLASVIYAEPESA